MAAVLKEKETGVPVGGRWHEIKAAGTLKQLSGLLERNSESGGALLNDSEFNLATGLAQRLTTALNAPDVAGKATEALTAPGQQMIRGLPQKLYEYTKNLTDSYGALQNAAAAMPNNTSAGGSDEQPAEDTPVSGGGGLTDALGTATDVVGALGMVAFLGSALYESATQPGGFYGWVERTDCSGESHPRQRSRS